jgi:ABC-type transporter Mla subunit MlaD
MQEDSAEHWARFLAERLFFDVCGFPTVLRSDRGPAFVSATIKALNEMLGIEQCFGASYHPQSQGHIEASHQRLNHVLAAYAAANPQTWPVWTKLAQWAVRSTPRDPHGMSPYEIILGLRPHGPLSDLFAKVENYTHVAVDSYVSQLQEGLRTTHDTVKKALELEFFGAAGAEQGAGGRQQVEGR